MTEYVVHADDFGYSESVNNCIKECFEKGWLSETSLMVNMPACDSGVILARHMGFAHRVGLHLNLTEGYPLTKPILGCPRFCSSNGTFNMIFHRSLFGRFFLSDEEIKSVSIEIEAQLQRFSKYKGLMMQIDSHHHVHTDWAIYKILCPLAKRYGFRQIRISADLHKVGIAKAFYKQIFNRVVRRDFCTVDHFDGFGDGVLLQPEGVVEIMVHPLRYNERLCDSHTPYEERITKVLSVPHSYIRK